MPASLDHILLYQARIIQQSRVASHIADLARLQETWLRVSLQALHILDIASGEKAVVKNVPDGDGLRLEDGRRVRYLGIDAPEVAQYGHPPQPYALTSKRLNGLLVARRQVLLIPDGDDRDRHNRLLRHVFVRGRWINAAMLLAGLAQPYRLDALSPPIADLLKMASALAQQRHIGLWRHP